MAFHYAKSGFLLATIVIFSVANDICYDDECAREVSFCSSPACVLRRQNLMKLLRNDPSCDQACFDGSLITDNIVEQIQTQEFEDCYRDCFERNDLYAPTTEEPTTTMPFFSPCPKVNNSCFEQERRCSSAACRAALTCFEGCNEDATCKASCGLPGLNGEPAINYAHGAYDCRKQLCSSTSTYTVRLNATDPATWIYITALPFASTGEPVNLNQQLDVPSNQYSVPLWVQLRNGLLIYWDGSQRRLLPFDLTAIAFHGVASGAAPPDSFPVRQSFDIAATYAYSSQEWQVTDRIDADILNQVLTNLAPGPPIARAPASPTTAARVQGIKRDGQPSGLGVGESESSVILSEEVLIAVAVCGVAIVVVMALIIRRVRHLRVGSHDLPPLEFVIQRPSRRRRDIQLQDIGDTDA
eukprot:TRINITY_DN183_c0_g1_i1.p1 TRINITY_DN183_c0_g1~~TRINITY_DN183_c0_g1_i1.p1  ORF type:complete len:412 (+),score=46.99 TRINITY_DN183_c0_g1_i1:134-1369(+)